MSGLVNMPRNEKDKAIKGNVICNIAAANKNLMTFDEIQEDIKIIAALHTFLSFLIFLFCRTATHSLTTSRDIRGK